jgi:hypothetical protein
MQFDLAIAIRVTPLFGKKHIRFESKYELVKASFDSLVGALAGVSYHLTVILDGCPKEYEDIFREKVSEDCLRIIHTDKIGNGPTFLLQLSILLEQTFADYVYFAEDDYFYIGKLIEMLQLINSNFSVDFVSPYDHPNLYQKPGSHPYKIIKIRFGNREWKDVMSTCCTFLTSKKTLEETKDTITSYRILSDHRMWYLITRKIPLFRFLTPIKWRPPIRTTLLLFYYLTKNHKHAYRLWVPEPTIATHLQRNCLSPNIDWDLYLPPERRKFGDKGYLTSLQ